MKYGNEGKVDASQCEPHGLEAHYFIESRLLQRDVEIILESVNNKNLVSEPTFIGLRSLLGRRGLQVMLQLTLAVRNYVLVLSRRL